MSQTSTMTGTLRKRRIVVCLALLYASTSANAQRTAPAKTFSWNVRQVVSRLLELGYSVDTAATPISAQNRQAVIAFQKVNGMRRTGKITDTVAIAVLAGRAPTARDSMHCMHLEVDLNRQVLFIVDSADAVRKVIPVSTGNGERFLFPGKDWREARTPRGLLRVYYKIGGWRKSPLGMMFYPMYILGGFAIHGSQSVPAVPASHGCVRVPMFVAATLFRTTPVGTPVVIFGENPKPHR